MADASLALEPVARVTLNELAYARLKHALLSGEYRKNKPPFRVLAAGSLA